jgi:DNA-binding NarL/FixJ family response regulator
MDHDERPLRIVVADDHALVRGGLALMVKIIDKNVTIVETSDFAETLACLAGDEPVDLLLSDLLMPGMNGAAGIRKICHGWPDVPVIVVSVKDDIAAIRESLEAGAMGYIPKTSSPEITISAIKLVLSGGVYVPPDVLRLTRSMGKRGQEPDELIEPGTEGGKSGHMSLTPRQMEVLELMALGKSNKAIASRLGLTPGTVKMHTSRIFRSLNVENRTEAVARYAELKSLANY